MAEQFRFLYEFNTQRVDGHAGMKDILGIKGAALAEMCRAGLSVPPGFTIPTRACHLLREDPDAFSREIFPQVAAAVKRLEEVSDRSFGSEQNALLLSVRSGSALSMPGMMDSILNLGLNDVTVKTLAEESGDPLFAYDCYRRLLQMFADIVLHVPGRKFEIALAGGQLDSLPELVQICKKFKQIIEDESKIFPAHPDEQLRQAVVAVFRSWDNPRAVTYRRLNDIPENLGTAVNVQMMVFGNRGENSGTGVGFTRHPSSGERRFYGEFLPRAQGQEVAAGRRTPLPLEELRRTHPEIYRQLEEITTSLEAHYREMQAFEFTIEQGRLYMLQTEAGKRTGQAAVRIALDMCREGLISPEEALLRVEPEQLEQLLHPVFKDLSGAEILGKGLPASAGAAVGAIVLSADEVTRWAERGEPVILVRPETTPDDVHGMERAEGILTARGGITSHAAVVARGLGKCCVVGCEALQIDLEKAEVRVHDRLLRQGEIISVDGHTGAVMLGRVEKIEADLEGGAFAQYMALLEEVETLAVRANVDTVGDARKARQFGAAGIGLCRTEHMFFSPERLALMREVILAESRAEREALLARLKAFQKEDFAAILEVMDGFPVTVRLLDPPLREFLPRKEELLQELEQLRRRGAERREIIKMERLLARVEELREVNPMLGHRGCRLGITYPEITRVQVEALFEAACDLKREGKDPHLEVMIPLVSLVEEFQNQAAVVRQVAAEVFQAQQLELPYLVGTMIELPRAALVADQIARYSEFFSFGTNDLTQTTFGFSRDDAGRYIKIYREKGILRWDPFRILDQQGVGELIALAVEKGKSTRPDLKLGLCGEHGGDPGAIRFCYRLKIDYVSCSPYRVPVARLAAAQAALTRK